MKLNTVDPDQMASPNCFPHSDLKYMLTTGMLQLNGIKNGKKCSKNKLSMEKVKKNVILVHVLLNISGESVCDPC